MSQQTPIIGASQSGLQYRTQDNDGKQALLNHHKGSAAPSYAEAGCIWLDDTATPWLLKIHDGTDWITMAAVNATTNEIENYSGSAAPRLLNHASDSGSANAYAIAPSPVASAYTAGQVVTLKPANANTGAATINVNSLGVKNIKLLDGSALTANALLTTGVYQLVYDGTNFVVLNPSISASGGKVLQSFLASTTTSISTGSISDGDTLPQNTEGTEILTQSITPIKSTSKIRVRGIAQTTGTNVQAIMALFVDSTANALARSATWNDGTAREYVTVAEVEHSPGDTNTHTYKMRCGNVTVNGTGTNSGSITTLVVEEIDV